MVAIVYTSQPQPPSPSHPPPLPLVSIWLFPVSLFLPWKQDCLYCFFPRFHRRVLIHGICFSVYDLLRSVWQSLCSSISLQMTQFHSVLWLINILLYIHESHLLYSFLCWWTFRLFPHPGIYKYCCSEHWGACVSLIMHVMFFSNFQNFFISFSSLSFIFSLYPSLLNKTAWIFSSIILSTSFKSY